MTSEASWSCSVRGWSHGNGDRLDVWRGSYWRKQRRECRHRDGEAHGDVPDRHTIRCGVSSSCGWSDAGWYRDKIQASSLTANTITFVTRNSAGTPVDAHFVFAGIGTRHPRWGRAVIRAALRFRDLMPMCRLASNLARGPGTQLATER